jgi:hypothetical protein
MLKVWTILQVTVAIAAVLNAGTAHAAERVPVQTMREVLVAAVRDGRIAATWVGEAAAKFQALARSGAPIEIDAVVIGPAGSGVPGAGGPSAADKPGNAQVRSDCKRLAIRTRQAGVIERGQDGRDLPPADKALAYAVDACADGTMVPGTLGKAPGARP